jgi:DNA-binding CsgD family transcriptional regulator
MTMTSDLSERTSEWRLVGRDRELAVLEHAAARARSGLTTVVLVSGEAGIGKSHLVNTARRSLADAGFRVLHGRAERMEQGLAYASLRQALQTDRRSWPPPAIEATEALEALLDRHDPGEVENPLFRHVYQRATAVLAELCAQSPTVLALDDLHVADADTVDLLALLVRRLPDVPLLLLLSRRNGAAAQATLAIDQLDDLAESGAVVQLPLEPLGREDIEALLTETVGAAPDPTLLAHVARRSWGNPFFVLEVVRALQRAGSVVVDDTGCHLIGDSSELTPLRRRTILERMVPVDDTAREVATAMAAFGRVGLDQLSLLSEITELDRHSVDHGFDQLVEVHVISHRDDGGFGFTHDLVAETLYEELGPATQRRLHGRVAEALRDRRAAGLPVELLELARHLDRSASPGDLAAATDIAAAGDLALRQAPRSAVEWYRRALDLLPTTAVERGAVLVRFAQALRWTGRSDDAAHACHDALALLEDADARDQAFNILGEIALVNGRRDQEATLRLIDAEIDRFGHRPRLLAERAAHQARLAMYGEAEADAEAALAASEPGTMPALQALFHLTHAVSNRGRLDLVRRYNEEQLTQAAQVSRAQLSTMAAWCACHLAVHGEHAEAAPYLEQARRDQTDPRGQLGAGVAELFSAWFGGNWDRAAALGSEMAGFFLMLGHHTLWAVFAHVAAEVALERGDPAPALALDPDKYPLDAEMAPLVLNSRAGAELVGRRTAEARDLLARALDLPCSPATLLCQARMIEACLLDDDRPAAERTLEAMADDVSRMDRRLAQVVLPLCEAQVRPDTDVTDALATAADMGLPFYEARLHLVLGERGIDPRGNLTAALALVDRLDAAPWRLRIAREMRRQGLPVPRRSTIAGELTESEQQIAQLVAAGYKNKEIADELCFSIKTVQTYLSRVYEKLGVRSRVELTRAMQEQRPA